MSRGRIFKHPDTTDADREKNLKKRAMEERANALDKWDTMEIKPINDEERVIRFLKKRTRAEHITNRVLKYVLWGMKYGIRFYPRSKEDKWDDRLGSSRLTGVIGKIREKKQYAHFSLISEILHENPQTKDMEFVIFDGITEKTSKKKERRPPEIIAEWQENRERLQATINKRTQNTVDNAMRSEVEIEQLERQDYDVRNNKRKRRSGTAMTKDLVGTCKVINLSQLEVSEFNARKQDLEPVNSEKFQELCNSIREDGLVEPIIVRPYLVNKHSYEVVAGTRRFRALKHIGQKVAPTIVREMDDNDVRIASLVENAHREGLDEDDKEDSLKAIYLATWDVWKPVVKSKWDNIVETPENKIKLAKAYLGRMAMQRVGRTGPDPSIQPSILNKEPSQRKYHPSPAFKHLVGRIGYTPGTQYKILRGIGSQSVNKDYVEELIPTIRDQFEADERIRKLEEAEKQKLAEKLHIATKPSRRKTKIQKAEKATKKFFKDLEKEKEKEKEKKKKSKEVLIEYEEPELEEEESEPEQIEPDPDKLMEKYQKEKPAKIQEPEIKKGVLRAREEILGLGNKIFNLLTDQELDMGNLKTGEMQAKSKTAEDNMRELATYMADESDRAAQQYVIIPLNLVFSKYRDILYEAGQAAKRKDDMLRP